MPSSARPDEEFVSCSNCGKLVNLSEYHPTVVVRHSVTANQTENLTLHFCSEDCLDEWTGPFP
ncbi:hypothetical protein [Haladaptatus sp. DYF46]|uniref:DUF7576 family protein n=1 Tax=Haladaptatus sp. DYF46 TaxID=2886041 RepID=UPI001E60FA37|nr:hypothetical protein [Haladaptatus sp. DYF46]